MNAFAEFSRQWLAWMASASWQLGLLIGLIAIATRLLRDASPRLRHALWLLALAKVFLPPGLATPVSIGRWGVGPLIRAVGIDHPAMPAATILESIRPKVSLGEDSSVATAGVPTRPHLPEFLLIAWLIGMGVFWTVIGSRYWRLLRRLGASESLDEGPVRVALERCALELGVSQTPELLATELTAGPFLLGVFRPRIVMPQALLAQLNDAELRVVLAHELMHWKRYDAWIGWLQTLALGLFWFHPLLWWANGKLRHERERACDEAVLRLTQISSEQYGRAILSVLTDIRGRSLAEAGLVGIFERGSKLQQRLEDIMTFDASERGFGWKSNLMIAALATAMLPMAPGAEPQAAAVAQAPDAANGGEKPAAPQVVKTIPAQGATGVDPQLSEIKVTFDRDMDSGMSWTGGPPEFPPVDKSRKPRWIDARTCVLPVKLDKGAYYRLGINSSSYQNFRSRKGAPVPPATIYFVTEGAHQDIQDRVKPPVVVSMEPQTGAEDVDPAVDSLRVTFDRPMGAGMSWTGGGPRFPQLREAQKATWSDDRLTCVLPVSLRPDHEYELGLNSASFNNFQSEWGVPLEPVVYKFRTRKAD